MALYFERRTEYLTGHREEWYLLTVSRLPSAERPSPYMQSSSRITPIVSLWLTVALIGCATGISQQARSLVTYRGPFSELQQRPEHHLEQVVHLGGKIIEASAGSGRSEVKVLQLPLDWQGRPMEGDRSDGRFILRSTDFLDPEVFRAGSLISVVGTLAGSETRPVGSFPYRHPVILPIETRHWSRLDDWYPAFHIDIGVGGRL